MVTKRMDGRTQNNKKGDANRPTSDRQACTFAAGGQTEDNR